MINIDVVRFRADMQLTIQELENFRSEAAMRMPGCSDKTCRVCKEQKNMLSRVDKRIAWLKSLICVFLIFMVVSCRDKIIQTDLMSEEAVVLETVYETAKHGSDIAPTISTSGQVSFTIIDVNIKSNYAVIFKCQHGKFIIEGRDEFNRKMWHNLEKGDKVTVHYYEIYQEVGKDKYKFIKYKFYGYEKLPQ